MKKICYLIPIAFTFLLCIGLCVKADYQTSEKTIYVDDDGGVDFENIQDAINNSNNGDTIFVYNGTYYENLVVNRSVKIVGENKTNTIIDGMKKTDTLNIQSSNVSITGFTIINSSYNFNDWYKAGIRVTGSNGIIHGNIIKDNMVGIFGKAVTNITIYDNEFFKDSIVFSLYDVGKREVPYDDKYYIHQIYDNTVNSKKIYYYLNQNDLVVPNDGGQIIAVNCNNISVCNLNLSNIDYSCIFVNCSNCLIEKSEITNSDGLLWLIRSKNNIIQNNEISNNFEGIVLDTKSTANIVQFNNIINNLYCGIIIEDSSNFNLIYKNNFIGNFPNSKFPLQASFLDCFKNIWRGNYWNRPRFLPQIIIGNIINDINWINFDWRAALKPYDIN